MRENDTCSWFVRYIIWSRMTDHWYELLDTDYLNWPVSALDAQIVDDCIATRLILHCL